MILKQIVFKHLKTMKNNRSKKTKIKMKKRGSRFIDRTGKTFNRLNVIRLDRIENKQTYWLCKCICGNTISVMGSYLTKGRIKSCGCLQKELAVLVNTIHGMYTTRFYNIWSNMKSRCFNKNHKIYPRYGGRGITVCERWLDFNNFKEDMYESYVEHVEEFGEKDTSLDRFPDNDGNYEPKNVRWATRHEQNLHTRISANSLNYKEHKYWRFRLRGCLHTNLKYNYESSPLLEPYLGCTLQEFRKYIESKFQEGMTWKNHGKGLGKWEMDHIVGCNNFDLSKEEDRKKCFNHKNLQPLWYEDHLKKTKFKKGKD